MTISAGIWPSEDVDSAQMDLMVRLAYDQDHNWKPPEPFAYDYDPEYDLVNFKSKLGTRRTHSQKLFYSLPRKAQEKFYLLYMLEGLSYVSDGLYSVSEVFTKPPSKERHDAVRKALTAVRRAVRQLFRSADLDQPPNTGENTPQV